MAHLSPDLMDPEETFVAALLAVGPPVQIRHAIDHAELNDHVREYNEFVSAALGRKSVTTATSYAVFTLWHHNKAEYRKLVKVWKENQDVMLPCLTKRKGR